MTASRSAEKPSGPPTFREARTRRQKARSAGMDPNHWYAVAKSSSLPRGEVLETKFCGFSIALFRAEDGIVRALENRCAHRSIKLSAGVVDKCRLVCPYHGWSYDGHGQAKIPHDTFGTEPRFKVPVIPVQEKYGLIFVFPGDPVQAKDRELPNIPELNGSAPWPHTIVELDCRSHFSMVLENVSDLTHEYLHRKYEPFSGARFLGCESHENGFYAQYEAKIAAGKAHDIFMKRSRNPLNVINYNFDYPYHWSNTGDSVKHVLFTLPLDSLNNRHIFIFYISPDIVEVPLVHLPIPRAAVQMMMGMSGQFVMGPLLRQDVWVIEHEQAAWNQHWDKPEPELNPVIVATQETLIRKWSDYDASLGSEKRRLFA